MNLDLIDSWLRLTSERQTFSSDEIRDLLLDLRQSALVDPTPTPEPELVPA